jgi:coronin-7
LNSHFHLLQTEFFQDDLFPPTKVTWHETLTSTEWFEGKNLNAKRISLQPDDMENLSATNSTHQTPPPIRAATNKVESFTDASPTHMFVSDATKAKQDALKKSLNDKVKMNFDELEQDAMEGVEEKEWEE